MPRRKPEPAPDPAADLDVSDPAIVRAIARMEQTQRAAVALYETHPWPFIRDCVRTLDEIDGQVKGVPRDPDGAPKPYLEYMTHAWHAHALNAWPKSRRMWMSWLAIACHYWLARFRPNSKIGFGAREEGKTEDEGSNELVKRCKFIHDHLAPLVPPMDVDYITGALRFANGSVILALPEGEHKARQHTFTAFLADEFAHWRWAYQTYVGLKPTIDGGGKITLISSAGPGFFEQIIYDRIH